MKVCEYGCGQEAGYQLKNGKWCCSLSQNSCSVIRKKMSEGNKGRPLSKATKKKMSESKKGKKTRPCSEETKKKLSATNKGKTLSEEHKKKIGKSSKGRTHSEATKKKLSEAQKGKTFSEEHKKKLSKSMKGKTRSEEIKRKISEAKKGQIPWNKYSLKDYQEKHPFFCQIEELKDNEKGEIQGHCKNHNCKNSKEKGGWFTLTSDKIYQRMQAIENPKGFGESNFYCCEECKNVCPLYRLSSDPFKTNELPYTSEEYQTFRTTVLKRDTHICQYCGEKATIVHHTKPQKLEPFFSLDIDLAISVCRDCHYKKGHSSGTPHSTGNLAKIICSVESQKFLNQ